MSNVKDTVQAANPSADQGPAAISLAPYAEMDHQVWVQTPQGGLYAYRTGVIRSAATRWADSWNQNTPEDVPAGTRFFVVKATTIYEEVR